MSAEKYYNSQNTQSQYSAPPGPPPSFQQTQGYDRGFTDYQQQPQPAYQQGGYYQQAPPQQGYYQQGPPQGGYYQPQQQPVYVQQQQQSADGQDCCLACLAACCLCCALDAIF